VLEYRRERRGGDVVVTGQSGSVGHHVGVSRNAPGGQRVADCDSTAFGRAQTVARGTGSFEQRFRVEILADLHQHRGDLA
jgi:hypothetical protein